jgi:hypothetical protein
MHGVYQMHLECIGWMGYYNLMDGWMDGWMKHLMSRVPSNGWHISNAFGVQWMDEIPLEWIM